MSRGEKMCRRDDEKKESLQESQQTDAPLIPEIIFPEDQETEILKAPETAPAVKRTTKAVEAPPDEPGSFFTQEEIDQVSKIAFSSLYKFSGFLRSEDKRDIVASALGEFATRQYRESTFKGQKNIICAIARRIAKKEVKRIIEEDTILESDLKRTDDEGKYDDNVDEKKYRKSDESTLSEFYGARADLKDQETALFEKEGIEKTECDILDYCMSTLSIACQNLIKLRDFKGRRYKDIGTMFDKTANAVKQQYHRCRDNLIACLVAHMDEVTA